MPKLFGGMFDSNEKEIKRLKPYVDRANELEPEFKKLTADELKAKTAEFKEKIKLSAAGVQSKLAGAQKELDEAKTCQAKAAWDEDKKDADNQCRRAQDKLDQLEKDRRKLESEVLNDILPEAFAAVREAALRTIGQRHYDVQLLGGVTLHLGKIAEMRTGEGKTLVATLPLYLNSLTGRGAHLATVNDYLARRDPYWMGPIYHALGVTVASIYPMQNQDERMPARIFDLSYDSGKEKDPWAHFRPISRKEAYEADITYGTSAEFGFDFLRDNMVSDISQRVQRASLYYCIVDEVDNLLIDEARTPLIISAPDTESGLLYQKFAALVGRMTREQDYEIKEKEQSAEPTEEGWDKLEMMLKRDGLLQKEDSLYTNNVLMHHLRNALSAKEFYKRDQKYVVENGEVIIVDEFTGRKMYGRRYSEGLHQAIEAKEHIKVQQETRTYATVTIQNYFRMYEKLGGMTGTAATEAEEFFKIYKLEVTEIPTNKPMIRKDLPDLIYKTEEGKYRAVAQEIKDLHDKGVPVLVGTVSIENSVKLSDILKRQGITCAVLNAKEHTKEAAIVSRAGELGAVTVATNMAGRGVDIILGGSPDGISREEWQQKHDKVIEMGGLHIIGTERHEARRIDNQLRGRAGRQGDPGQSQFFISLEDDIMRRFGGDRMKTVMGWVGLDEETPIQNKIITNMITDVQKRVEGYHFDVRKNLVEYDDVVNTQRGLIYAERAKILSGANLKSNILEMVRKELAGITASHNFEHAEDTSEVSALLTEVNRIIPLPADFTVKTASNMTRPELEQKLIEIVNTTYESREQQMGAEKMRLLEKLIMLQVLDRLWMELLTEMDHMRLQASLNTMRQMRSADSYKMIGSEKFNELRATFQHDVAGMIFHVSFTEKHQNKAPQSPMAKANIGSKGDSKPAPSGNKKVGRNEPCPCGSGKKYKHCHGK